jgi:uncharacterized protein YkwD
MQLKTLLVGVLLGGGLVWAFTTGVVTVDPSAAGIAGNGPLAENTSENSTGNSTWEDLAGGALQPDELNDTQVERLVWEYVNQERASNGLSSLSDRSQLSSAADEHAANMAEHDYVGHDQPDGGSPDERYAATCPGGSGENANAAYYKDEFTAYGTGETLYLTNESQVAHYIVDSWMRSDGHRENILGSYEKTGVGVNVTDSGKVYAAQAFC